MSRDIAVLYFTDSPEKEASLKSANSILESLGSVAYPVKLTVSNWLSIITSLDTSTLCFLASHGGLGEDGTLQAALEARGIQHTHSNAATSALLTDKHKTKLIYTALAIPTPAWQYANQYFGNHRDASSYLEKPRTGGSKRGIKRVSRLVVTLGDTIQEELIEGKLEVSIIILRKADEHIPLLPVVRGRNTNKIGETYGANLYEIPAATLALCQRQAVKLSRALNCYGITKTDFVIDTAGLAYAIETDAIPGLGQDNAASIAALQSEITYKRLLKIIMETRYHV